MTRQPLGRGEDLLRHRVEAEDRGVDIGDPLRQLRGRQRVVVGALDQLVAGIPQNLLVRPFASSETSGP